MSANPQRADPPAGPPPGVSPTAPEPAPGETVRRKVVITNPQGLHLRPAAAFAQQATQFAGSVTVAKDTVRVNGKSAMELFLLLAEQGAELEIEVCGSDARQVIDVLAELLVRIPPDEPPAGAAAGG